MSQDVIAIGQEGADKAGTREITRERGKDKVSQWRDKGTKDKRKRPEKILFIIHG